MKLYYEYTDIGISKDVNCTHAYEFLNDDGTISTYVEYENSMKKYLKKYEQYIKQKTPLI